MRIYENVAYSWAGVNIGIVLGFVLGMTLFYNIHQYIGDTHVSKLKNALLALALTKIKNNDFNTDLNYLAYDGSQLPPLSGCSTENACFTYILKNPLYLPFYSQHMDRKQEAICKYLEKHLNTKEQILAFFKTFVEIISDWETETEKDDEAEID